MMDAYLIAGVSKDLLDVVRVIREEVAGVLVPPIEDAVHASAAIRGDQAPEELPWITNDDLLLPALEKDWTLVLPPQTMLGEEARPVPPVGEDLDTSDLPDRRAF
jgi:hypothetical protein